ncbi:MAG: hypothetical protein ACK5PS_08145 [Desulfopila sp.]
MAPARMISFMEKHAAECPVCQKDPDLIDEIAKITELILPESKIPKAIRMQNRTAEDEEEEETDEDEDDTDDNGDDDEEEDVYDDDDDDFEDESDLIDK